MSSECPERLFTPESVPLLHRPIYSPHSLENAFSYHRMTSEAVTFFTTVAKEAS